MAAEARPSVPLHGATSVGLLAGCSVTWPPAGRTGVTVARDQSGTCCGPSRSSRHWSTQAGILPLARPTVLLRTARSASGSTVRLHPQLAFGRPLPEKTPARATRQHQAPHWRATTEASGLLRRRRTACGARRPADKPVKPSLSQEGDSPQHLFSAVPCRVVGLKIEEPEERQVQ